jgi:predicted TIM-barrel fold metal-dependent hydrolase
MTQQNFRDHVISVDDHVQEPPELWTRRLSKSKWGDRVPHVEQQADGTERWIVDGRKSELEGVALAGALMADRSDEPQRWEEVPRMAYVPAERLKALDAGGIDYSVLYPTVAGVAGEVFGRIHDPELELACVQAYNDWLVEEWAGASPRFIPQCIVPLLPAAAVQEIKRAVAKGHRGVIYPGIPMELRDVPHINEPDYDPVWATCQDLDVPVCFHAGSSAQIQLQPYDGYSPKLKKAVEAMTGPASSIFIVVNLLLSRILFRFPKLKVVFSESALGWGNYLLQYADFQFENDRIYLEGYALKPSELFRRQCYLTTWYDRASLQNPGPIGAENILWSTNFPLATSTWPNSRDAIALCFEGLADGARRQILCDNAAELYKIDKKVA